jgi:creatinine amidohydrolase
MLAINPQSVRLEKLDIGNVQPMSELQHDLQTQGVKAVSENGILGNASTATAEHGEEMLTALTNDLRSFIHTTFEQWTIA